MEFHPVSNIFPLLSGQEYEDLKNDISKNGLIEPIWIYSNQIIDGRNRYRVCTDLGIEPEYKTWHGNGSLISFVISLNLHRRHLTSSQRAALAVEVLPLLEEEARERQRATYLVGKGIQQQDMVCQLIDTPSKEDGRATQQAAELFGTNREYVHIANELKHNVPDIFDQVKNGEKNARQAMREYKNNNKVAPPPLEGKYRVIYADPPWKYGNNMPEYFFEQADHYPLMTVKEVTEMDIKSIAEDNAVLFLWVTSPILDECFEVVKAWGFKYKASFIWDKVKHNMGHYNSVRHELLLICVRGSCQPDVKKLFDSVQTIERSGEHSEKPEEFRRIIDTIYPNGKRIELFSRKKVEGWCIYGNEPEK